MKCYNLHPFQPQALVIGNGDLTSPGFVQRWANSAPFIVCCDGAANQLAQLEIEPDLIIGDLDSLSPDAARRYADRLIRVSEQETNDLTKAVRYLHEEKGMSMVLIVGGTGHREDHTLGNISLLIHYLRHGVTAIMAMPYGLFIPCYGPTQIKTRQGQQVSIFNADCKKMKGENLKYQLSPFSMLWQGTLNEALADVVSIDADGYFLVYLAF